MKTIIILCSAIFSLANSHLVINTEPDIEFYFINKHCPINGIRIHAKDTKRIRGLGFSEEKPTLFIIHGWTDKRNGQVIETIAKAALEALDLNIIAVDWSNILRKTYVEAVSFVPKIGRLVGEFLENLVNDICLDLASTTVVGHSLGAHVAGIACAHVGSKCDLIVGLDPTFSLFPLGKKDNRLDSSDAEFVQVIHTSCGLLGIEWPIGHADYYPNGGKEQIGCLLDITGVCRHARSYLYYAESLVTGHFKAHKCTNYLDYLIGKCNNEPESFMGQYYVDRCARGSYYLKTRGSSPFAWI